MKRVWIILLVVVVLVAAVAGYRALSAPQSTTPTVEAGETPGAELENVVWASGQLVPRRWAGLSPATNGTVQTVAVAEGDQVAAGTLLVELNNGALQSQVQVAAAAVTEAEAAQDKLLAGATAAELAAAQAQVSAGQAAVAVAQAGLQQAQEGIAAAEAQVRIAQAQYAELAARSNDAELVAAQRQVDLAQAAVEQAQAAYDRVRGDPDIGARPEALALEQATISLGAARAAYDVAARGATGPQLAVVQAQVDAARAQVRVAQSQVPSAEAAVQAAQAQLAQAQAGLDRAQTGATAEDKAMAEARVESARAALATAEATLAQAQVTAPFDGQVGTVYVRPGELAVPGQPVLMLGDTSQMYVETTDLRETDVTRLQVGMPVEVTFDALPNRGFQGTITRVAPMSNTERGSTNYTVDIDVPDLDSNLRWGMTAFVNIQVQ